VSRIPLIVSRQRLDKNHPIVARQRLRRNVTAVANTHAIEELLDASFLMWPVPYQGKCIPPPIVARQRLGKNPPIVARQRLGRNVNAITNTHAAIEELLDASFLMWPVPYQGKQAISSSQNFLFRIPEDGQSPKPSNSE
jgi:hypothetical protein